MHAPTLQPAPARVGSYALTRLVGEGSMGRVFEARHVKLDRVAAIKLLRSEQANNAELVQRFFQEARTVNRIDHPHIVQIHDFVEDRDEQGRPQAYCVMEYVPGQTLAELIRNEPLTLTRIVGILDQVCRALEAAHEVGVIHRDIKPDNVLVTRAPDGTDLAKVLDFGVAKLVEPDPEVSLGHTVEGAIVGTPRYMPPEQAASLDVDFRADTYGVGCLLYEMLCGSPPFDGDSFGTLVAKILTSPPEPLPSRTCAGEPLPPALHTLALECLEKDPGLRPGTMLAVRKRLAAALEPARPAPPWRPVLALLPFVVAGVVAGAYGLSTADAEVGPLELPGPAEVAQATAQPGPERAPPVRREDDTERGTVENPIAPPPEVTDASPLQTRPAPRARTHGPRPRTGDSRDAVLNPFAN